MQAKDTEYSAVEEQMKQKIKEITSLTQELNKLKTLQQETLKENTELSGVKVNQFGCCKYLFIQHLALLNLGILNAELSISLTFYFIFEMKVKCAF